MVKNIKNKYGLRNSNLRKKRINEEYSVDYKDGELELRVDINKYYDCPDINDNYYLTELCMDILQDSGIIDELALAVTNTKFEFGHEYDGGDMPNFDIENLYDRKFQEKFFNELCNRVKDIAEKIEDNSLYPSYWNDNED